MCLPYVGLLSRSLSSITMCLGIVEMNIDRKATSYFLLHSGSIVENYIGSIEIVILAGCFFGITSRCMN